MMNIVSIYDKFPTQKSCIEYLEKVKWSDKPKCPYCKSHKYTQSDKEKTQHRYFCSTCRTSYRVTVGTIFHKTKLDLRKWFLAISLVLNAKKGIAARQVARDLGINKDTAWSMLMRIRKAMVEYGELLQGIVEADETYIGGKERNKHWNKKTSNSQGRSTKTKTPVLGVIERGGNVRAKKVKDVTGKTLKDSIRENVEKNSTVMTDEWKSYNGLNKDYMHKKVNHGKGEYVNGEIYTNTIESFWTLFKRGYMGQYHQLSKKHLNKNLDEFCFRFNNRENDKSFDLTIERGLGV